MNNEDVKKKLMSRVVVTESSCWEWQGCITKNYREHKKTGGYGLMSAWDGRVMLTHRISWILFRGNIPKGVNVLHDCDNRKCCNPDHLFLGSQEDNMKDMAEKGRSAKGSKHGQSKLTEDDVLSMRKMHAENMRYGYMKVLTDKFKVSREMVWLIVTRKLWTHI